MRRNGPRNDGSRVRGRGGILLVDLLISISVTGFLVVVVGGLVSAVHTTWDHTQSLQTATAQAAAARTRIDFMVAHSGTYRGSNGTVLGVRLVSHLVSGTAHYDTLVVWSGGREGGMADQGELARLPVASEVVIYTPDRSDPSQLNEVHLDDDLLPVDFESPQFAQVVDAILVHPDATEIPVCMDLRISRAGASSLASGCVFFAHREFPPVADRHAAAPGSAQWYSLPWVQGIASGTSGLCQANVRMELQIMPSGRAVGSDSVERALPFFGGVARRYTYSR